MGSLLSVLVQSHTHIHTLAQLFFFNNSAYIYYFRFVRSFIRIRIGINNLFWIDKVHNP